MTSQPRHIAVLGSTGSIGQSTLDVVAASGGAMRVAAISAHQRLDLLAEQAQQVEPRWVVATDAEAAVDRDWKDLPANCELLTGTEGLTKIVQHEQIAVVVAAIVGSAGLRSTWAALEAGKIVALANKETLVMAGPLVMELAARTGGKLLPIDSEHSAIFQAMQAGKRSEVRRVVLTASGGPFRNMTLEQLQDVTVEQALAHPTWDMGPKITVDSATMMNKALEIVEARWLFDLQPEQIEVVIHPQSTVHSFVEFVDGSVIAQMSPPDMKMPIQYALTWPDRTASVAVEMDWSTAFSLDFEPADYRRFGALQLGIDTARAGGTAGAVLNAANESAVAGFLDGQIGFADIVPACQSVVDNHPFQPQPDLETLIDLDRWAREEVFRACT
ncbi:MAG: 1-deoxy-D-xylulose-5-phosphate reductoisomerase [Planctomycetota bacterium]|nr:1-deoxy-D-xylulose-5-phosphate reductoisomerase [Planctomycetota bacterium]